MEVRRVSSSSWCRWHGAPCLSMGYVRLPVMSNIPQGLQGVGLGAEVSAPIHVLSSSIPPSALLSPVVQP